MKFQKIQRTYYRLELTEDEVDTLMNILNNYSLCDKESHDIKDFRSTLDKQINMCNKYEMEYPTNKE